jgi:hypothetical protein
LPSHDGLAGVERPSSDSPHSEFQPSATDGHSKAEVEPTDLAATSDAGGLPGEDDAASADGDPFAGCIRAITEAGLVDSDDSQAVDFSEVAGPDQSVARLDRIRQHNRSYPSERLLARLFEPAPSADVTGFPSSSGLRETLARPFKWAKRRPLWSGFSNPSCCGFLLLATDAQGCETIVFARSASGRLSLDAEWRVPGLSSLSTVQSLRAGFLEALRQSPFRLMQSKPLDLLFYDRRLFPALELLAAGVRKSLPLCPEIFATQLPRLTVEQVECMMNWLASPVSDDLQDHPLVCCLVSRRQELSAMMGRSLADLISLVEISVALSPFDERQERISA